MRECIVFLDIDGTLLDINQRPTIQTLPALIDELSRAGAFFGLNSNRAFEDVVSVIKEFHLTGPFILENGAYIKNTLESESIMQGGIIQNIPIIVEESLNELLPKLFYNPHILKCDTVKMVTSEPEEKGAYLYMNCYRHYSASIHGRFDGNMNMNEMRKLSESLQIYFSDKNIPLQAVVHEHGATVTVEIPGIDKGSGLAFLHKNNPEAYIIAIGDGLGDVSLRPYVDRLYAVSNAVKHLKKVSDRIANQPMTKGVYELLDLHVRKDVAKIIP